MKIKVLGIDPSLRNWGFAEGMLDLETGILDTPILTLICPKDLQGKQVRQNSNDIYLAEQAMSGAMPLIKAAKVIFVEVPVGSQSSRASVSYGVCVGVLGSIRVMGYPFIQVTALAVKKALTGNENASKADMIQQAMLDYPNANFPMHRGIVAGKAEHLADAIGAIHAGVLTPDFQNVIRIFQSL